MEGCATSSTSPYKMDDYDERDEDFNILSTSTSFTNNINDVVEVYYATSVRTESYTYDKTGNRLTSNELLLSLTGIVKGTLSRTYQYYTNSDRLLTDGVYAYKYDKNGNLVAKGDKLIVGEDVVDIGAVTDWSDYKNPLNLVLSSTGKYWAYQYDLKNRLVSVNSPDETDDIAYKYDGRDLRIKRSKGSEIAYYNFGINNEVLSKSASDGTFIKYMYFGQGIIAIEKTKDGNTDRYYTHGNHIGTIEMATDATGNVVYDNELTPFGLSLFPESDIVGQIFTGKELDDDTGLYYFNARWYDPSLGAFITQDPIKDGLNWYAYCGANPINYIDPTGLEYEFHIDENGDIIIDWPELPPNEPIDDNDNDNGDDESTATASTSTIAVSTGNSNNSSLTPVWNETLDGTMANALASIKTSTYSAPPADIVTDEPEMQIEMGDWNDPSVIAFNKKKALEELAKLAAKTIKAESYNSYAGVYDYYVNYLKANKEDFSHTSCNKVADIIVDTINNKFPNIAFDSASINRMKQYFKDNPDKGKYLGKIEWQKNADKSWTLTDSSVDVALEQLKYMEAGALSLNITPDPVGSDKWFSGHASFGYLNPDMTSAKPNIRQLLKQTGGYAFGAGIFEWEFNKGSPSGVLSQQYILVNPGMKEYPTPWGRPSEVFVFYNK